MQINFISMLSLHCMGHFLLESGRYWVQISRRTKNAVREELQKVEKGCCSIWELGGVLITPHVKNYFAKCQKGHWAWRVY